MSEEKLEPWDRQAQEGIKAYTAFCLYRDMGTQRSLDTSYRRHLGQESSLKQASGNWKGWYAQHDWKRRAEAYDAYLEGLNRRVLEEKHLSRLGDLRDQQDRLGRASVEISIALLNRLGTRIKGIEADDIPVKAIPAFLRAVAAVSDAATNAQAQALAVEELLRVIGPQNGPNAERF